MANNADPDQTTQLFYLDVHTGRKRAMADFNRVRRRVCSSLIYDQIIPCMMHNVCSWMLDAIRSNYTMYDAHCM